MFQYKALLVATSLAASMSASAATISVQSADINNGTVASLFQYDNGALVDYQLEKGAFQASSVFTSSEPVDSKIELSFNQQTDFTDGIFSFNGEDFAITENFVLYRPLLASNTLDLMGNSIANFTRYSLNVSQVPIPAAFLLMAPLLLGAAAFRRKLVASS